jgi:hypothetical protein
MAGMKNRATIIGLAAAAVLLYAVRFSQHPVRWIIGLLIAVPITTAIVAGLARSVD